MREIRALLVIVLSFSLLNGCTDNNSGQKELSLYDAILERGSIKVGYISYPPGFLVNPDGSFGGIFYDAIEKIGQNLDLKIEYVEEVTWDGMIESVKQGRIDMVCSPVWPTSQRGKHVDFTSPLFFSVVKAYTQYGNQNFDGNLQKINSPNVSISTIDGEMTAIIASIDFPKARQETVTQLTGVSQTLLEVMTAKADVTFVEPAVALAFDAKNPDSIKEIPGVDPLRVFPNVMMVPKGQVALQSTLNTAISELINNGFIESLLEKYEEYPNSFYRVQSPYLTPR